MKTNSKLFKNTTAGGLVFLFWVFIVWIAISLSGCTENSKAKTFGGTARLTLPAGQKLINATWKDDDFWYLTRPMHEDEFPEVYTFKEESSLGVLEGTYIITETK
jgi:hypothetical protein